MAIITILTIALPYSSFAQSLQSRIDALKKLPCCDFSEVPGVIWVGNDPVMTVRELAAYCGPVLWFSPDEPLLNGAQGVGIRIPEPLFFEEPADSAIVYYRVRTILVRRDAEGEAFTPDSYDENQSILNLENITGFDLDYFFYYHKEGGSYGHKHDTEAAYFKVAVWKRDNCPDCRYALIVTRAIGKAHGLNWYDNTLDVDTQTVFPMTLLVEEGKHASCTDKNADGYYTPGYDVNKRVNDAWGVRDVMGAGYMFTGGFQSWMAKVRREEHRVFPPLPDDSPLREKYLVDGLYAPENAKYVLRPMPAAAFHDPELRHFLSDKGDPDWPAVEVLDEFKQFQRWVQAERWVKSLAVAFRYDGDAGLSFSFPLFVVKHFEDPLAGGFLVHRMYLKDNDFRDFGWMLNYTLSASRWIDGYFAGGVEWDVVDLPEGVETPTARESNFVFETGIKFRVSLAGSPLKFLTVLTDYWGVRFGVKSTGAFDINRLAFVIEIGAGAW